MDYNFPDTLNLTLVSIKYNSPGKIDFLGLGEIVKQIKEFVLEIIKVKGNKKLNEIEVFKQEEELKKLKLENLEKIFEMSNKYGLNQDVTAELLKLNGFVHDNIQALVKKDKINNIELISEEDME